jgi:microcystin degradation protein MlrC
MRIAIAGLSIEVMLNSPLVTDKAALQYYGPKAVLENGLWLIRGALERLAEEPDIEVVPIHWVTALPGGPLTRETYEEIKMETVRQLRNAGPLDGVVLANHGALEVEGLEIDADTDFVMAVRNELGPTVRLALALDLHGDMTPELLDAVSAVSVLRTAPHRDDRDTGRRAANQLVHVLRCHLIPKKAAVRLPMLIPGEMAITSAAPADALYGSLAEIDAQPGVIEANILTGFAWNDRPWTGATALVTAEDSVETARNHALALAKRIWDQRHEFRLRSESAGIDEGLSAAINSRRFPIFLSDSGDNTTAGAPGDLTFTLQAVLDRSDLRPVTVLGITAPQVVQRCHSAGVGATVTLDLGSEHVSGPRTIKRAVGVVEEFGNELQVKGFQPYRSTEGVWAKVRFGNVIATFHSLRIGITTPGHFRAMGIDPLANAIHVVKLGYLHPQLEDIAARHIVLLTDGVSQLDMRKLAWSRIQRPMYPLDIEMSWSAEQGLYGDR